jgi:hypothetical protein
MTFSFIRLFLNCMLWCLGLQGPAPKGASGFGEDELVKKRELTTFERSLKATCTGLFIMASFSNFDLSFNFLFQSDTYWCAIPSAAWIVFMLSQKSIPMDAEAISTGLWTFAPYVAFLLWFVIVPFNFERIPYHSLLWQALGVGAIIAYGLFRDISKEMTEKN